MTNQYIVILLTITFSCLASIFLSISCFQLVKVNIIVYVLLYFLGSNKKSCVECVQQLLF